MQAPRIDEKHLQESTINHHLAHAQTHADKVCEKKEAIHDPEVISEVIDEYEKYYYHTIIAAHLAEALLNTRTNDEQAIETHKKTSRELNELYKKTLFFEQAISKQPTQIIEQLKNTHPEYENLIQQLHEQAQYQLPEETEQLISTIQESGTSSIQRIREIITNNYEYTLTIDGEQKTLNAGEIRQQMRSEDREIRKEAYQEYARPIHEDKLVHYELFESTINNYNDVHVELRGYQSPIQIRHLANQIDKEVYEALKKSNNKHKDLWTRFLKKKKELHGYKHLYAYDLYAGLPGLEKNISYQQATKRITQAFTQLDEWMSDSATQVLESGRVDAQPRTGKYSGAFCLAVARKETPIILLNYTGDYENVETLAHELGHAIHDIQAQDNKQLVFKPPLVLAETASNLAETLLFESSYQAADQETKRALLDHRITGLMASIPVQMMYTEFEEYAHKHRNDKNMRELDEQWRKLQDEIMSVITREDKHSYRWMTIPHFQQAPFYCYSYSFGALLSLALYNDFQEHNDASDIQAFLQAGGSKPPQELLEQHGYDISSQQFWDKGFARIEELLERLESL